MVVAASHCSLMVVVMVEILLEKDRLAVLTGLYYRKLGLVGSFLEGVLWVVYEKSLTLAALVLVHKGYIFPSRLVTQCLLSSCKKKKKKKKK